MWSINKDKIILIGILILAFLLRFYNLGYAEFTGDEAIVVAKALGIKLSTEDPIRYALGTAKATGDNVNSMLQDIKARKRTEIDSITGYVVERARELGINTPYSDAIFGLIKALESRQLKESIEKSEDSTLSSEELLKVLTTS